MSCNAANIRRRVKNLSEDEVLRKRAIDRENQRYSRAKTKTYIQSLEKRVAELTYQLQDAQNTLDACVCRRDHFAHLRLDDLPEPQLKASALQNNAPTKDLVQDIFPVSTSFNQQPFTLDEVAPEFLQLPMDFGTGITVSSCSADPTNVDFWDLSMTDPTDILALLEDSPPRAMSLEHATELDDPESPSLEVWQQMPLHILPSSKLDEVITETMSSWRVRAQQRGQQEAELTEPVFPNISSLLNPLAAKDEPQPATKYCDVRLPPLSSIVAAQVGRCSIPVARILERIGFMYNLSHLIRWLVCRSRESYYAMPTFMRPTHLQRTVPHPPWVDTIVWPQARDDIIREMDWTRFEELRWLGGPGMSINWQFGLAGAVTKSPDGRFVMLNQAFEAHLHKLENWTSGKEVSEAFPFLKPYCS